MPRLTRRGVIGGIGAAALAPLVPGWARAVSAGLAPDATTLAGIDLRLRVAHLHATIDGRGSHAIGINGVAPAPLVRLKEGARVRLTVDNALDEDTSIHWHGLLVPFHMDGVPGVSFPGIRPGASFAYEFPLLQSGTYWYHSHSGLQEQMGHYGPLIVDPAGADPIAADREHVILLSDHSTLHPHTLFGKLKARDGYFNRAKQTLGGLAAGRDQPLGDRLAWAAMRMDPTDLADVTAAAYTYLVNGHGPGDNWTGLFHPGERVRLRVINASAMTTFNVRIPGLALEVVAADGLPVRPVMVDEFQIGVAETYDVVVTPREDRAYTLVGESVDRSGMARATLAPRPGMTAPVPVLRPRPLLTMRDMGMDHDAHTARADAACPPEHAAMGHCTPGEPPAPMKHAMRDFANAPGVKRSPTVQTIAPMPVDRTGDPGLGLDEAGHRVLTYRDLVATTRNPDARAPSRALTIHLTGNMDRYMWAFDGAKLSEHPAPFAFDEGERVRVTLVNDTMMAHPIHLHGHFFELVTGHGAHAPRKHTVNVQPGGTVTFDLTADAPGDWAFHCHLLYHMHAGMMQVVTVRPRAAAA